MRVILKQDVKKLGKQGDIVNVAEGYGRNFLIPRGMAVEASKANLRSLEHRKTVQEEKAQKEEREAQELAERLSELEIVIKAKTGEAGRLFGSVTAQDVADAVGEAAGIELDKRRVELPDPIKTLGQYMIPVKLFQGVAAEVAVKVVSQ